MSGGFRARRPPSPTPAFPPVAPAPRFPVHEREHFLDADEKRAAARGIGPKSKVYPLGGLKLSSGEWKLLLGLVLVAAGVRLYRLSKPASVVFDEVHFGKFASKYIKSQYFVDVHPPLAKLLITLAAFVSGFDGNFDFKDIGKVYENTPYVAMRMLPATLGVATVPLTYLTLRGLDCRATSALIGSLFVTFENGLITQSRLILLDSPLLFFTALTTFFWVGFCNENRHKPFTESWWLWLFLSGMSLGAVVSCKWVGLFTIATLGFSTIHQLWILLGDLRVTPRLFMKHFMARAICLIAVPILFYMSMFGIHFLILSNSGDGDGFMSSQFQHTLNGRGMSDTFAGKSSCLAVFHETDVALGSEVAIRHLNTQGGYLHSHAHNYPEGSKQQQITLYPHRDTNNNWRILNATADQDQEFDWENSPLEYITSGMQIKLAHVTTDKKLHSHDVRPPISEVDFQNEVSGYGAVGFGGDANDNWVVEIEHGDKSDRQSGKRLRTLRTIFRLRHTYQGCYLFSHKVKLPDWGFEQQEVTCNKNAVKDNSLWYIETNIHPQLHDGSERVNYRLPGFLAKFWELQQVMWTTNAGLTDRHTFDSRPQHWPVLRRGINFWVKDHRQIYLLGNPVVWSLSTLSVLTYLAVRGVLILRAQRGYRDFENSKVVKYDGLCGFLFMGWALHYFPFYLMQRQLFLHHYFPALYFAILLSCAVFDIATNPLRQRTRLYLAVGLIVMVIWTFAHFSPLAYGTPWTRKECEKAKWHKTWDFSCNDFYNDYSAYSGQPVEVAAPTGVATQVVGGQDGGRGAVVVDQADLVEPAHEEPDIDTTNALWNQAEPGRDVFAGELVKEVRSESVAGQALDDSLEEEEEEKIISTVYMPVGQVEEMETTSAAEAEEPMETVEVVETVFVEEPGEAEDVTEPSTSTTTDYKVEEENDEEEKVKKAGGPLGHDETEAEMARNELFPEEADA